MKGYLDVSELEKYKKADIQKLARDMGLSDAGTIKEIAARCAAVEIEVEEGELTEKERNALKEGQTEEAEKAAGGQIQETAGQQAENGAKDATGGPQEAAEKDKVEITRGPEKTQEGAGKAAAGVITVEVVARYLDQQFNQIKEAGEVFTVDRERAAVLVHEKVVKIRE